MIENNTDTLEIAKFDELCNDWWEPEGPLKTLHHINPARLSFIKHHLPLINKRIVDIGCGGGILTESLAREGCLVSGIDLAPQAISTARRHAEENNLNIDYQCIDVSLFAKTHSQKFDAVVCMELLEHVPSPADFIHEAAKLVKPQGFIFFSTLNRNLTAYLKAIVAAEYIFKLLPKGTHDYEKFIKPSELVAWARQANLKCIDLKGLDYNPFAKTATLSSNTTVNYLAAFQKVSS